MADPNQPAPAPQPDPKQPEQPKPGDKTPPPAEDRLTLSPAELEARIQAALAADRRKAEDKAKKDREAAEAEEAKKRGEFEKVANAEKAKREEAERERDALRRERTVEKALTKAAAEQEGYPLSVFEEYVLPKLLTTLPADADEDAVAKAAKDAVAKYVTDNPRQAKGGAGAPPATARAGTRGVGGVARQPQNNERPARRFSTLNYRA